MWVLRFLTGPNAGQTVPLTKAKTLLGRAPSCDIKVASSSVSKEHTRIEILEDRLLISDAGSRNGTFLNGVQIRSAKARSGDRVAIHDIIFEVQQLPDQWAIPMMTGQPISPYGGNLAQQAHWPQPTTEPAAEDPDPASQAVAFAQRIPLFLERASQFLDKEVLPGVYKVPEMFEMRWVLAGFMGLFIFMVTSLSTVPLIRILKVSIQEESQQHALTIATTLAKVNRPALQQGMDSSVSVDLAVTRPGVKTALIISNLDGNVIAPASKAGTYPDLPYIHELRKLNRESVKQVDDNTVVAVVPVDFYDADTGTQVVKADAVVFYDMGSMAVDDAQVISLFISTLFIALLVGTILFFFLYKIVEYPFKSLNTQLDSALKDGHDTIQINYRFPALQTLASNVSSALARSLNGSQESGKIVEHDRNREITNLIELVGFAAMGIYAHDLSIAAVNQSFEQRTGMTAQQAMSMTVNSISDQALKLSIKDLIERVDNKPDELASNELEFSGQDYQVVAQAVYGTAKIAYYLIVLLPKEEPS
jgi:hypothetical protein